MTFKLNATVAAAALLAAAGAQADIQYPTAPPGDSSVLFVAWDKGSTESVAIDLGVNMTAFLQASTFVNNSGSLAYTGSNVTAQWSLTGNTLAVNGANVAGDNNWSGALATFQANAVGGYTWGVIAADSIPNAISATNTVNNKNILFTGIPTQGAIDTWTSSTTISNATANFNNFAIKSNSLGTHPTNANGADVANSGDGSAFMGGVMKDRMGGATAWSYMSEVGATTNFSLVEQFGNPVVYQIGTSYGVDTLLTQGAATFTFDGSTLTYNVAAVPEPGTYALLMAGLTAIGFTVRRRRNG